MLCIMIVPQQDRYTLMPLKIYGSNLSLSQNTTTNASSGNKADINIRLSTTKLFTFIFPKIKATRVLICRRLAHVVLILFIVGVLILPVLYNAFHQNPSIRHCK